MIKLGNRVRVLNVIPLDALNVRVTFDTGEVRDINLDRYMWGPIFESIRSDPSHFRRVRVEGGTIAWENGADIDPYVLYYDLTPASLEADSVSGG